MAGPPKLRHLARRIGEVETELKKAKELLGGFEWKRAEIKKAKELSGGFEWKRVEMEQIANNRKFLILFSRMYHSGLWQESGRLTTN